MFTLTRAPLLAAALIAALAAPPRPAVADTDGDACPQASLVLMIGDGMGLGQINAARIAAHGAAGHLAMETLPVLGLVRIHALDNLITDSAASATAMASGIKTLNQRIGLDVDGNAMTTIMDLAERRGMATGVVATSSVTHATPASFATHVEHRKMENEIARQLVHSDLDLILGGGRGFFVPRSERGSLRRDGQDLLETARAAGFRLVTDQAALTADTGPGRLLGLFANEAMSGREGEPTLELMTRSALRHLGAAGSGFVLMVEGSQIDWGGHDRDIDRVIDELLAFDAAVATAIDFVAASPCTLLLVTADHETGGLALLGGDPAGGQPKTGFITRHHTAVDVPLFAGGYRSDLFAGVLDNTDIARRAARALGLGTLPRRLESAERTGAPAH